MKKGFTLIELLIAIAVLGVLATIVLMSSLGTREKARDARRISDINQIRIALEAYYEQSPQFAQTYPENISDLVTEGLLPGEPKDPSTDASYSYQAMKQTGSTYKGYCIGAKLETNHQVINQSASCDSGNAEDNYKVVR